jgi:GAF domain-containing protein
MDNVFADDIDAVQAIPQVPAILESFSLLTGLRVVCISRVTQSDWIACAAYDTINFGIVPGDSLDIASTLCADARESEEALVINDLAADPNYRFHPAARVHGCQSYLSVPLYRANGAYFGTLCGFDRCRPHRSAMRR